MYDLSHMFCASFLSESSTDNQQGHLMQPYLIIPLRRLHDRTRPTKDEPLLPSSSSGRDRSSRSEVQFPKPAPINVKHSTLETIRVVGMRASACANTCQTEYGTMYDRRMRERGRWVVQEK